MSAVDVGLTESVLTFFGFYVINQDEVGVRLTMGNYTGNSTPGLGFAIPIFQKVLKTKASIQTIDLPDQKIVLQGNIAVKISGSVNFKVADPQKAILEVNDYAYSLRLLALTTISEVLGTKTIEQIRSEKKLIADEIEVIIAHTSKSWGLSHVDIKLTDAEMDESLLRAMMRETEAEKETKAAEIKATSDKTVAKILAEAARSLQESPGALTLRVLQSLTDMSNSKSTIVMPIPIELFPNGVHNTFNGQNTQITSQVSAYKVTKTYDQNGTSKFDCPKCNKTYNAKNILNNAKFDRDPDEPGIQLICKVCSCMFTLEG